MTELTELQSADAYCRHLAARHYENFSVVSIFLSRDMRRHLARIYAYCRTTDDFGDESGPGQAGYARLESWRDAVRDCFSRPQEAIHPVLISLSQTVRDRQLEIQPFLDLIQANMQDQTASQYETWDELRAYCVLSAASVGRMVLGVFRLDDALATSLSDDVCIGLQLANHAQDVRRDGLRGRTYLPQQDIRDMGVRGAIRSLCDRAEDLLASGERLESMVPIPLRTQLALYRLGGLAVVRGIRKAGYRTDEVRPTLGSTTKLCLLGHALLESMARLEHATPQRAA